MQYFVVGCNSLWLDAIVAIVQLVCDVSRAIPLVQACNSLGVGCNSLWGDAIVAIVAIVYGLEGRNSF